MTKNRGLSGLGLGLAALALGHSRTFDEQLAPRLRVFVLLVSVIIQRVAPS